MATQGEHTKLSLLAGADLSSSQYKIVKLASTAGEVVVGAAATDNVIGVLLNDPADGEVAEIAVAGIVKVQAEASQSAGATVASSTTGRAKVTSTGNDGVLGTLLDASTSAGDIVRVLVSISNY